jgi:hypothetical protein
MIKTTFYISLIFIPIVAILIFIMAGMVYTGMDATTTRTLECQNVVVENTLAVNSGGMSYFIIVNDTPRMILDTTKISVIKKWAKINLGDIVYMKLGKQTAVFC